jgi:hypothetical protein
MRTRSPNRKLRIESLEDRRLTAAAITQYPAPISAAPRTESALVQSISSTEQFSLTRGLTDASGWTKGLRVNHNETLVRNRRRKQRQGRSLRIESLEDRKLTATLAGSFSSLSVVPTSSTALVSTITPIQQGSLSRVLVDTSGWVQGLRPNHNETLVTARRRNKAKDR